MAYQNRRDVRRTEAGYDLSRLLHIGLELLAAWVAVLVFFDGEWTPIRKIRLVVLAALVLCLYLAGRRPQQGRRMSRRR